jgi:hypothetical protein
MGPGGQASVVQVFQMSSSDRWGDVPPVPAELAAKLEGMEPRAGAAWTVANARATIAGRPVDPLDAQRLERNLALFLETPAGRERKAHIDGSLGI